MLRSKIVSVDGHIVLLEESTARNPEFDDDRFELADMNKLFRMLPGSTDSQRQKEENHKNVHGKGISKIKGKFNIVS